VNEYIQGNRLGSVGDRATAPPGSQTRRSYEDNPKPVVNKDLTDGERETIRAERAAAAEARAKKNQIGNRKKKKASTNEPLRGPNSQNTMAWNV